MLINLCYDLGLLSAQYIPIIINNYNRHSFLIRLITALKRYGFRKIVILDNNSTYLPLLDYYRQTDCEVVRLQSNYGHLALWKSGMYKKYRWDYYVYTDPDVLPIESCPDDFLVYFRSLLSRFRHLDKVGFGIMIDDLPECFSLRDKVRKYEARYWNSPVGDGLYDAPIDTTLALYKPLTHLKDGHAYTLRAYRTGPPYLLRHLPWYQDTSNPDEEEMYYRSSAGKSSSLAQQYKGGHTVY